MTPKSNYIFTFSCPNNWGGYTFCKSIRVTRRVGLHQRMILSRYLRCPDSPN